MNREPGDVEPNWRSILQQYDKAVAKYEAMVHEAKLDSSNYDQDNGEMININDWEEEE